MKRKSESLSPPPAVGRTLQPMDIKCLIEKNRFHSVSLRLPCQCNLRCPYCYGAVRRTPGGGQELEYDEILSILMDAFDLGVTTVSIVGDGEPLLYRDTDKDIFSLLRYIRDTGKRIVLFTNGTLIGTKEARELFELGAIVIAKQNSLNDKVQNELIGQKQAARMREGLKYLMEAGFAEKARLGVHTIICKQNYREIPSLWRIWRKQGLIPYVQVAVPPADSRTRDRFLQDYWVSPEIVKRVFSCLLQIDEKEFGYTWDPDRTYPIAAMGCSVVRGGFGVTPKGDVQLCAYTEAPVGNVRKQPLKAILEQPIVLRIRQHVYEDGQWPFYGCRALTLNLTGNRFSPDPFYWGTCKEKTGAQMSVR